MGKIQKKNKTITITGSDGRISDNISARALDGPHAPPLVTVALRDVDLELLQFQYEALQRVTANMPEEGDLAVLTGLVEALGDSLPLPDDD